MRFFEIGSGQTGFALSNYLALLVVALALASMVILMIAGHILAAVTGKPDKRDKRDRFIEWRADSNSS